MSKERICSLLFIFTLVSISLTEVSVAQYLPGTQLPPLFSGSVSCSFWGWDQGGTAGNCSLQQDFIVSRMARGGGVINVASVALPANCNIGEDHLSGNINLRFQDPVTSPFKLDAVYMQLTKILAAAPGTVLAYANVGPFYVKLGETFHIYAESMASGAAAGSTSSPSTTQEVGGNCELKLKRIVTTSSLKATLRK